MMLHSCGVGLPTLICALKSCCGKNMDATKKFSCILMLCVYKSQFDGCLQLSNNQLRQLRLPLEVNCPTVFVEEKLLNVTPQLSPTYSFFFFHV